MYITYLSLLSPAPPNVAESSWFHQETIETSQNVVLAPGTHSSEKIDGTIASRIASSTTSTTTGVRSSKSHANYLQQCNKEMLTMVDIDLDMGRSTNILCTIATCRPITYVLFNMVLLSFETF